jgi:hypothetical protein
MAEGADHGFLRTVLGFCFIPDHGENRYVYESLVGPDQLMEKLRFSSENAPDQGRFLLWRRVHYHFAGSYTHSADLLLFNHSWEAKNRK